MYLIDPNLDLSQAGFLTICVCVCALGCTLTHTHSRSHTCTHTYVYTHTYVSALQIYTPMDQTYLHIGNYTTTVNLLLSIFLYLQDGGWIPLSQKMHIELCKRKPAVFQPVWHGITINPEWNLGKLLIQGELCLKSQLGK